ncbi:hypothetical protein V8G39_004146 [Salmonella enterica]|nr:hypothetical protein [Salmonella enterica]ELH6529257.1 hypothetical protein [Salmonella enterica]
MIYVNSTVLGRQGQSMSPGNAPAPQEMPSTPGKFITPKETHSYLRNNDLPAMGWKITKGSLYKNGYQQIRSADGEFEMQYQLSADDLDSLLRYDGQMSIKLYLGYASQTQLSEPTRGLFDVYLRIPEAIATARIPTSRIPPATLGKPYLVAAYRIETYKDGTYNRLRITNLPDLKTGIAYGDNWSPEITINFNDAEVALNGYGVWPYSLGRTSINIPEGAICIRSAPNPLDVIAISNVGISVVHEPSGYTLSPDDDGATIYAPYVCSTYRITIPGKVFPKGFSVAFLGRGFSINAASGATIGGIRDFYPFNGVNTVAKRLTQVGDDGKTWIVT